MRNSNKKKPQQITITEYGLFASGTGRTAENGITRLPEKTFDTLRDFVLSYSQTDAKTKTDSDTNPLEFFQLSSRKSIGEVIVAKNYVGVVTLKDGTTIEILPKIAGKAVTEEDSRKILLAMLRTLKKSHYEKSNMSSLRTTRLHLLDIFITMFVDEATQLTKRGLKAAYIPVEANEHYFKGKLLVSQNIRANLCDRTRFFVRYDEFNTNRPENRLVKSTLAFLLNKTQCEKNRQSIVKLLSVFEDVDFSSHYHADFTKCQSDRSMSHYELALSWCRVFLFGNSFTPSPGSEIAMALLFPMEKLFEEYIAAKIRRYLDPKITLKTQDRHYSLFNDNKFPLRPDIVLTKTPESGGEVVVMDTKWKLLKSHNDISQADMYQMYAYGKKYAAPKEPNDKQTVVVIYPKSDVSETDFYSNDDVHVAVRFVDLLPDKVDESVEDLLKEFGLVRKS